MNKNNVLYSSDEKKYAIIFYITFNKVRRNGIAE